MARWSAILGDGRWWDDERQVWRDGRGRSLKLAPPSSFPAGRQIETTKVVLACAHLDHDPGNSALINLKALCQRCYMIHDKAEHLRQRWFTYRLRKALGDLFSGTVSLATMIAPIDSKKVQPILRMSSLNFPLSTGENAYFRLIL